MDVPCVIDVVVVAAVAAVVKLSVVYAGSTVAVEEDPTSKANCLLDLLENGTIKEVETILETGKKPILSGGFLATST